MAKAFTLKIRDKKLRRKFRKNKAVQEYLRSVEDTLNKPEVTAVIMDKTMEAICGKQLG